ncbi:MAG: response regulator [Desulfobacterales bacterium]|nr:response regulator [Desulfobacterales bacterium]
MGKYSKVSLKNSISTKLLRLVFSLYILIAMTLTLAHMTAEYRNTKHTVLNELKGLQPTFEASLGRALWEFNIQQVQVTIDGLLEIPIIVGAKIEDATGKEIVMIGTVINNKGTQLTIATNKDTPSYKPNHMFSDIFYYSFPIRYTNEFGETTTEGRGTFYSSTNVIWKKVQYGFIIIILSSFIKTIALWIIFLIFARTLLNRPLKILTDAAERLELDNLDDVKIDIKTKGRTELKVLEEAFNSMVEKLTSAREKLHTYMEKLKLKNEALVNSEKKYRNIFNKALEGIFQITPDGKFISANPAMARILGYRSPDELLMRITEIETQLFADPKQFSDLLRKLSTKKTIKNYETRLIRKDKTLMWGSIKIQKEVNEDNKISHIEGLIEDITDQKYAEELLINAYKEVEQQVYERTVELRMANEQLKYAKDTAIKAAQSKSEFLANMSHEIRTPMNGVIAAADLALGLNSDSKIERYLSIIQSSGHSLLSIINDILDFSKIESGKMIFEETPFNLNEIFDNLSNMFSAKLLEMHKQIELIIDIQPGTPISLIGDKTRLQQVLTNLLGNAVKFTEKGYILFGVKDLQKEGNMVKLQFYVKDTGIGIKQSYLENLFEPFTQADASISRKYGGTGLGMTISKKLIELMNGNMWAESELGKGTTFYFTVDLNYQLNQDDRYKIPPEIKNLNALVIDDCEETQIIISKYLNALGFKTECIYSGNEALDNLKKIRSPVNSINFIVIDWLMPGINGIETTKKIRKELQLQIPIIMVSAFGKIDEEDEAISSGVNFYIAKPVSINTLYEAIMKAFGFSDQINTNLKEKIKKIDVLDRNILAGRQILLAEDNLTNQEIAIAVLSQGKMIVDIANNGREAVDAVYRKDYDAVLMDMQMPEMDGYEATRLIRKDIRFLELPIIAMTAHAMKGDKEKCLDAGMNGYVTKPINQQKLIKTLGQFIKDKKKVDINQEKQAQIVKNDKSIKHILPENILGIDMQNAKESLGIDDVTFKKILISFFRNNQSSMENIKTTFQQKDWENLRELAHSLKGSTSNIRANEVQIAAEIIENTSKDSSKRKPDSKMIENLENKMNQLMASLKTLLEPEPDIVNSSIEKIDTEKIKPVIICLINALTDSDPSKIKIYYTNLLTHIGFQKTSSLKACIEDFDYELAAEQVKIIADELGIAI